MTKSHTKRLICNIPEVLRSDVVSVIVGESEPGVHEFLPVQANGFPVLIFVYGDIPILHYNTFRIVPHSRLVVAGQIENDDIRMEIKGTFGQIGVILNPMSTYYLFHKCGGYFLNEWKNVIKAAPIPLQNCVDELLAKTIMEERVEKLFDILKQLLHQKLPSIPWLDATINTILQRDGKVSQKELVSKANVGARHFRRQFKKVVGVSPKYFSKVIQLNTTIELLKSSNFEKLNYMALDCGYYDQAHFTNDFKNFIGTNPRDFLNGEHEFMRNYLGRRRFTL